MWRFKFENSVSWRGGVIMDIIVCYNDLASTFHAFVQFFYPTYPILKYNVHKMEFVIFAHVPL